MILRVKIYDGTERFRGNLRAVPPGQSASTVVNRGSLSSSMEVEN